MGFSRSPSLCLLCPLLSSAFLFFFLTPCGTCPSHCSKHQISSSLRAFKLDCVPQGHISALSLDAPSQTRARLEGRFPPFSCGRGETWGELQALRDPRQRYLGLAGARRKENLPEHLFPSCFISPHSFQGLKKPLDELYAGTRLLLGTDQWLSGERCH